jgi:hypothetical protein
MPLHYLQLEQTDADRKRHKNNDAREDPVADERSTRRSSAPRRF